MTKYLLIIIGVLLLACTVLTKCNRDKDEHLIASNQSVAALTDSIRIIKDKKTGQITLQKPVFTERLNPKQVNLNVNQKALFKAVNKKTVAAVHVVSRVEITGVINSKPVVTDSVQVFRNWSDTLSYQITVTPGKLSIDTLYIPNTAVIKFTEDKKQMVVNITNTNPLLKTQDIQGYVLPKKKTSLLAKIINLLF